MRIIKMILNLFRKSLFYDDPRAFIKYKKKSCFKAIKIFLHFFIHTHKLKVRETPLFVHNEAIPIMYYEIYDDNLFIFMYSNDVIETKSEENCGRI